MFNPMMGNMNMNQLGYTNNINQTMLNFSMDDTALKIKAIIEPYEKKIAELEKIIKEKDFEIIVLKEKINKLQSNQMMMNNQINMNNNINMMNPMINPMMNSLMNNNIVNWMDQYNINMGNNNMNLNLDNFNNNINIDYKDGFILNKKITFIYKGKEYIEPFHNEEKLEKVFRRVCKKIGIKLKNLKFLVDNNKLISTTKYYMTIAQFGIMECNKIFIRDDNSNNNSDDEESDGYENCECDGPKMNPIFTTTKGRKILIIIGIGHTIGTLLKKYLAKEGELNIDEKNICFLYNGIVLKFGDKRKIGDFFGINKNPNIIVNDIYNLVVGV